jgi:coenzyme Q-binding protein COQ10
MPTHAERQIVPYRPEQIFDLVADVGKYPQFLPWCTAARVRSSTHAELVADITVGFGPFRETFTSRDALDRPAHIRVRYEHGPFRYLNNQWDFLPHEQGCEVDFFIDFEFRSRILQAAIGVVFNEAVRRMVGAFLKRARDVYGPPPVIIAPAGTAHPTAVPPGTAQPGTAAPDATSPTKPSPAQG